MIITALVLLPLVGALAAFLLPGAAQRRVVLLLAALGHTGLTVAACLLVPDPILWGWLGLDALGRLFLVTTSALFLVVSFYAAGSLESETNHAECDDEHANHQGVLLAGLLSFLSMMTLVTVSQHFGVLWIAVEGTTLASAPLVFHHRSPGALEATWKYLVICSVGIAIALLGTFFLATAGEFVPGRIIPLDLASMRAAADLLNPEWLRGAFVLMLVGYGTKMGLVPMHTWLPDAHSEAPSYGSALLSATLLNCAWLGILRMRQVLAAAGLVDFADHLLVVFGLLSMVMAGFFILGQTDFKRMLAYSSVEHMGILALGVGLGGVGLSGSMLHLVNHSVAKGLLFLAAGNTLAAYGTRSIPDVRGILTHKPVTGVLWIIGLLAIVGSPPFGTFHSELTVLRGALTGHGVLVPVIYLGALALAFLGLSGSVLRMVQGVPRNQPPGVSGNEPRWSVLPPVLLGAIALLLGVWIPGFLGALVEQAAHAATGG